MSSEDVILPTSTDEAKQMEMSKTDEEKSGVQEASQVSITDDEKTKVTGEESKADEKIVESTSVSDTIVDGLVKTDNGEPSAESEGGEKSKDVKDVVETEDDNITETETVSKENESNSANTGTDKNPECDVENTSKSPVPEYTPPASSASWVSDNDAVDTPRDKKDNESLDAHNADQVKEMPAEGSNPADPATTQPETEAEAEPNVADNSQHQLFPDGITPADDTEKQPEPEVTSSDKADETPNATPEENHASETQTKEENTPAKTNSGDPIDQEQLDQKVKENVELQQKLESALSNQQAEREAFKNLTDENAKLQKHHDDMKEKFDEIQSEHFMTKAELETLRDVNNQQKDQIAKLETEVRVLKETQGGDEVVKDLQEKLIRLSNEQEEKDKRIHSLEGQLDATEEKLKQAEAKADRNENAPKSKTCSIM